MTVERQELLRQLAQHDARGDREARQALPFRQGVVTAVAAGPPPSCSVRIGGPAGTVVAGVRIASHLGQPIVGDTVWVLITPDGDPTVVWVVDALGWTAPALLNSWVDYGGSFATAGYRKVAGVVYLKGLVKLGTIPSTVFTLPAGFRPAGQRIFTTLANAVVARVDVDTFGNVVVDTAAGGNAWLSLDPITFPAEQ